MGTLLIIMIILFIIEVIWSPRINRINNRGYFRHYQNNPMGVSWFLWYNKYCFNNRTRDYIRLS